LQKLKPEVEICNRKQYLTSTQVVLHLSNFWSRILKYSQQP